MSRYREHLQAAVATSAAPYGYTLTIWTSGAVVTHSQGIPTTLDALLLMIGAVLGFLAVGWFAHRSAAGILSTARRFDVQLWGGLHLFSVGLAIGAAALLTALLPGAIDWPLVGFAVTGVYLLVIAAQFTITEVVQESDDS